MWQFGMHLQFYEDISYFSESVFNKVIIFYLRLTSGSQAAGLDSKIFRRNIIWGQIIEILIKSHYLKFKISQKAQNLRNKSQTSSRPGSHLTRYFGHLIIWLVVFYAVVHFSWNTMIVTSLKIYIVKIFDKLK